MEINLLYSYRKNGALLTYNDHQESRIMNPFISVIIPTYNRHHILPDTVRYLLDQDYPNYEIIVVDQTDEVVPDDIKAFFSSFDNEMVRYIHVEEIGLINARNAGIKEARGEIILFVDDDIKPFDRFFVRNHAANYLDPNVIGIAGRIDDPRYPMTRDPKQALRKRQWGTFKGNKNVTVRTTAYILHGGNMSFRRKDAIQCGLFDKNIIGNAIYEDTEFSLRLSKYRSGYFVLDPNAAVYHLAEPSGGCENRATSRRLLHFWHYLNMTYISLKHRDIINIPLFFIGRLLALLPRALKTNCLTQFYWLVYAMYLGVQTYRTGRLPNQVIAQIRDRLQ